MTDEIMAVKEARALMPDTTKHLSDNEVQVLIDKLEFLAGTFVEMVQFDSDFRVNIEYNRGQKLE